MSSSLTLLHSLQGAPSPPEACSVVPDETRLQYSQGKPPVVRVLTMEDPLSLPDPRPPTPGPHPRPPPIPPQPPVPTPPPSPHTSVINSLRDNHDVSQQPGDIPATPIKPLHCPHPPRPPTPGPNRPGPVGPRPNVPTPPPSPRRRSGAATASSLSRSKPAREAISISQLLPGQANTTTKSTALVLESSEVGGTKRSSHRHRAAVPQPPELLLLLPGRGPTKGSSNTKPPNSSRLRQPPLALALPLLDDDGCAGVKLQLEARPKLTTQGPGHMSSGKRHSSSSPSYCFPPSTTRPIRSVLVILASRFLSSHGGLETTSCCI